MLLKRRRSSSKPESGNGLALSVFVTFTSKLSALKPTSVLHHRSYQLAKQDVLLKSMPGSREVEGDQAFEPKLRREEEGRRGGRRRRCLLDQVRDGSLIAVGALSTHQVSEDCFENDFSLPKPSKFSLLDSVWK